jgi:hypothetical protein
VQEVSGKLGRSGRGRISAVVKHAPTTTLLAQLGATLIDYNLLSARLNCLSLLFDPGDPSVGRTLLGSRRHRSHCLVCSCSLPFAWRQRDVRATCGCTNGQFQPDSASSARRRAPRRDRLQGQQCRSVSFYPSLFILRLYSLRFHYLLPPRSYHSTYAPNSHPSPCQSLSYISLPSPSLSSPSPISPTYPFSPLRLLNPH